MDVDQAGGLFERLRAQAQFLRSRRRHRAQRRGAAAALRASGSARRRDQVRQGQCVLRRRQHPHARQGDARPQGELLQVHQRDAARDRGRQRRIPSQTYVCAINGNAAGGGYELALAADHIMLVDDRRSAVALPETPLLAVLPGTGGLTRVTDKRKVRRDRADVFCSIEEGVRGAKAVEWRLVDEVVPKSKWKETVARARAGDRRAFRPAEGRQGHRADAARAQDRRRPRVLFARRGRDRPRARACDRHRARPRRRRCRHRSRPRMRSAPSSGRSPWRASWKTRSCICASTSRRSACVLLRTDGDAQAVLDHDEFLAQGQWRLADARDPPLPQARAQARRRDRRRASSR